jgi:hypothetical protein
MPAALRAIARASASAGPIGQMIGRNGGALTWWADRRPERDTPAGREGRRA